MTPLLDVVRAHILTDTRPPKKIEPMKNHTILRIPLTKTHKLALGIPATSYALLSVIVRTPASTPDNGATSNGEASVDNDASVEFEIDVKES